jgi:CDP-2,3-bis-(O-geranylgeranyl)-sn-glycerol synthase
VTTTPLDPLACAAFLLVAFGLAGVVQAAWLSSSQARRLQWPIDGGRTFRGRRIFGDNKTARGFVVMPAATGLSFLLVSSLGSPYATGLWLLTPAQYGALGLLAGLGFMAGELPNSFVKRRFDVAPGAAADGWLARRLFFLMDRLDSSAGVLVALWAVVTVPAATAAYVLVAGPLMHAAFSALTFRWGGKARAA